MDTSNDKKNGEEGNDVKGGGESVDKDPEKRLGPNLSPFSM